MHRYSEDVRCVICFVSFVFVDGIISIKQVILLIEMDNFNDNTLKQAIMIIYEVNLIIENSIYEEFSSWLREHINEMLQFPGFVKVVLLYEEQNEMADKEKLTVQYQIKNRTDLQRYLTEFSAKMREEARQRFDRQFSATRRIFEIKDTISKL